MQKYNLFLKVKVVTVYKNIKNCFFFAEMSHPKHFSYILTLIMIHFLQVGYKSCSVISTKNKLYYQNNLSFTFKLYPDVNGDPLSTSWRQTTRPSFSSSSLPSSLWVHGFHCQSFIPGRSANLRKPKQNDFR